MSMSVVNNSAAYNTYRNLSSTQGTLSKSLEKLSSGFRINRAADDAAGLAISEGLRSQVNGLNQAVRNAQDGISVVQTAEGALNETTSILQRMRTLAVQAANSGSLSDDAKDNINTEVTQLKEELTRIADSTKFNGTALLNGSYGGTFQVGANVGEVIKVSITATMSAAGLGLGSISLAATGGNANAAISALDAAIKTVSTQRANLGAYQNRFEHTVNNLQVSIENLTASESRIRDTDMASEMVKFTSTQILQQAGSAMLAQAKNLPQSVLSLLQG
ncbi:flagellin N-terminal helical domain-containing protein [Quadrisphaera sp. KR29]|uniref:flagellin N-terminal helical domain-containing protein n=1 Tax=Quadrisphaera sp. KR29 TaxID=3461391 RepID=UPI0040449476